MNLRYLKAYLLTAAIGLSANHAHAQTQRGIDLDGEAAGDSSGFSVSMPDANTIAIGAPRNDGNWAAMGQVRIYAWNGTAWAQKGADIDGVELFDNSGLSISMPDANTIANGVPYNDHNGANAGQARVYRWNGTVWTPKGAFIDGSTDGTYLGYSVSMPDSNTLAAGAPFAGANGSGVGQVKIYRWNGTAWVQKGATLEGAAPDDNAGLAISMPDTQTVAIGSYLNDGNGTDAGHVRIFEWTGNAWTQKGGDIEGEAAGDFAGYAVSMPNANTVAIGAYLNDGNGAEAGHARIYEWNGTAWAQKGADIDGDGAGDLTGVSVTMPDDQTVAIGGLGAAGHVKIYTWNGSTWAQAGTTIDGETTGDFFGFAVSMPDASTVGIGAIANDGTGADAGHARVYDLNAVGTEDGSLATKIKLYPNPTTGELSVTFGKAYATVTVTVRNAIGQEVQRETYTAHQQVDLHLSGPAGIYLLEIAAEGKNAVVKVVKE